jgi:hypothetical protein
MPRDGDLLQEIGGPGCALRSPVPGGEFSLRLGLRAMYKTPVAGP